MICGEEALRNVSHRVSQALLTSHLPDRRHRDVHYVPSDRFAWYLVFHSSGHACQVLTRARHSFLINCTLVLLARFCQTTSIAWLTHQFKVARFVGCPATVATPPIPISSLPSHLALCLPQEWKHLAMLEKSFHLGVLLGSITVRWP